MYSTEDIRRHTEEVKRLARGRWDIIFRALVPQIAPALERPGRHITCPFHGGKNDFRVANATSSHPSYLEDGRCYCSCGTWDGFGMVMFANGWDFVRAKREIEAVLRGVGYSAPSPVIRVSRYRENRSHQDQRIRERIRRWWRETVPLDAPEAAPARRYFRNRQLGQVLMPIEDIGFHPGLEYFEDSKLLGRYPALISIVRRPTGEVSTVHRTWLTTDGHKAPVPEPRKQYSSPSNSPVMGSAIRLDKWESPVLHIAEGLETALAVRAIMDNAHPVWSTLNKELLRGIELPDYVQLLVIWADRDASYGGQKAAIELMDRIRANGRWAVVMMPPYQIPEGAKGVDWNDVIAATGLEATRNLLQVVRLNQGIQSFLSRRRGHGVVEPRKEVMA